MSSMAPLRTLGRTRSTSSPPCEMSWLSLCSAVWLISFVAALIIPGATLPAWLTRSLPAYAKSYLLRKPPSCLFLPYRAVHLFFCFIFFSSLPAHSEILNFLVQLQENQKACFFFYNNIIFKRSVQYFYPQVMFTFKDFF